MTGSDDQTVEAQNAGNLTEAIPPARSRRGRKRGLELEFIPDDFFKPIDVAPLFPSHGPLEVDLGCGDGSFLVAMALKHPDRIYLGTERLMGRLHTACRKADVACATNVRLLRVESAYLVQYLLPPGSVSRLYVMFPDPWPKRRHWPRRLVQPDFLVSCAGALKSGGELCIKTDDADYFKYIEKTATGCPRFHRDAWDEDVPRTDFERHYVAEGRKFHSLRLTKL